MSSLYDITGRALALMEMADNGELEEEVLKDTWEGLEGEFDAKAEVYCKVIKNIDGDVKALDAEIKRLTEKKKALENNISRMKDTLYQSMKAIGKEKAGGQILKASIQKNGGVLPLIYKDEDVPADFQKVEMKTDTAKIREQLDKGVELSFAHYGERGESIRIK